jgi:cytochrome P450
LSSHEQANPSVVDQQTAPCVHFDHWKTSHTLLTLRPLYEALLEHPISWSDEHGGFWVVTGYDEIKAIELNPGRFSSAKGVFLPRPDGFPPIVALEQDPPDHTAMRLLYRQWLSAETIKAQEPMIRVLSRSTIGEFAAHGGGDFVREVSETLPVQIIAVSLGLEEEATRIHELTSLIASPGNPDAVFSLIELLQSQIIARRAEPKNDFLSTLIHSKLDGHLISDQEAIGWLLGAVTAGHETTLLAGAGLALQLAQDPDLQQRIADMPELVPQVVNESLRLHPPVLAFFRTVTEDCQTGGVTMRKGDKVMLAFGAGNIDRRRFPNPLKFEPDRIFSGHLSFGWGIHRCVGAPLAQLELAVLAEELLRFRFIVDGPVEFGPPTANGSFIGISRLPLAPTAGEP